MKKRITDQRKRLLELLKREEPIWKDEDHPELQAGASEWVRNVRAEGELRFERIPYQRDRD